jgi:hypothetical protein
VAYFSVNHRTRVCTHGENRYMQTQHRARRYSIVHAAQVRRHCLMLSFLSLALTFQRASSKFAPDEPTLPMQCNHVERRNYHGHALRIYLIIAYGGEKQTIYLLPSLPLRTHLHTMAVRFDACRLEFGPSPNSMFDITNSKGITTIIFARATLMEEV